MKYNWKTDKYIELIEKTSNPFLREYIDSELSYIAHNIENSKEKVFIDVGAGYGRVLPQLSVIAKKIFEVEMDKQMLVELRKRALQYQNVSIIECDAQQLSSSLENFDIRKPVVICLQNSLGTPYGDPYKIISEMIKVTQNKGELVISLFIQEGLKDYGISIYNSVSELVGEPDLEKIDFAEGIFVSKTGYMAHWWKQEEREKIIKLVGGIVINEIIGKCYYILHVKY